MRREGTFTNLCPTIRQIRGRQRVFLISASELPSTQKSPNVKVVCFGVAYSATLQGKCNKGLVNEKLISRSKKEMENFIQTKFEDYNPGRASQKALRTVPPVRSQGTVM